MQKVTKAAYIRKSKAIMHAMDGLAFQRGRLTEAQYEAQMKRYEEALAANRAAFEAGRA